MNPSKAIGTNTLRKESAEKVTGRIRYLGDHSFTGLLHAALVTSPHAHADILSIDVQEALALPGVFAVATGEDFEMNLGLYLGDKPPLARGKVRHYGEPVAAVVAETPQLARQAAARVRVTYAPLKALLSPAEALAPEAAVIHEAMETYTHIGAILPEPGSNVANRTKIRKGDTAAAFAACAWTIEDTFEFPPGDHVAMEPRVSVAEISPSGHVTIHSATQAPFVVRNLMAAFFNIPAGQITVIAPPIGGGFGGKAGIQLEGLAYLLSKAVGGRPVKLANSREEDLTASPGHIGLQARVKLGCDADGALLAAEMTYLFDSGGYADYAVNISRAAAISCTGPYNIPNIRCDSLCVYTNRPFATAYRGFGHVELAFAIERALDLLADKAAIDPLALRLRNAIQAGDISPTGQLMDHNTGDLKGCLSVIAKSLEWNPAPRRLPDGHIRAVGIASLWKAPAMPPGTDAGAILTFNEDGTMNLHTGITEIGQGTKTGLAQLVAERFQTSPADVRVVYEVNTQTAPHDWATAASRSLLMAGNAALAAADDALAKIRRTAAIVLRCAPHELTVAGGRVFLPDEPSVGLPLTAVVLGYSYENGNTIEGQVIGRGSYMSRRLSGLDPETGEGTPVLEWTLGAQGVEIDLDPEDGSYRILSAASCMDVGRVINPEMARGQVAGAITMALGFAKYEGFTFNSRGQVTNDDLRSFKIPRFGEEPVYHIDFLETPQQDGPYGARGLGEQGVVGIPAALANALSRAAGVQLNALPLTHEAVWKAMKPEVKSL